MDIEPTPPPVERPIDLKLLLTPVNVWRIATFIFGFISLSISGTIRLSGDSYNIVIPSADFFGYALIANSLITGLIDALAKDQRTRRRSRRWYYGLTFGFIAVLAGYLIIPTLE